MAPTHSALGQPADVVTPGEDVPNPFVLVEDGTYYLFATQHDASGPNVPLRTSRDRTTWSAPVDAMPVLPGWAIDGFIWAPDVFRVADGSYVMWYTAGVRNSKPPGAHPMMCIGVAVASSPSGPYSPVGDRPTICQTDRWGSIDPRAFAAGDGRRWLHWKSDDNADVAGDERASIYAQELSSDGQAVIGEPHRILEVDQPWEGRIVEAPQMVEENGEHWLFYSGNWFNQPSYAIGVARCDGPAGPCTKPTQAPWLASNAQGLGPGEASLFHDRGGWWIVYSPTAVLVPGGNPRPVALAGVEFGAGGPVLR